MSTIKWGVRRTVAAGVTVLTTLAVLAAATVPAVLAGARAADAAGVAAGSWPFQTICAQGELTGTGTATPFQVQLSGWATPCPATDPATVPDARLGLSRYYTAGGAIGVSPAATFDPTTGQAQLSVGLYGTYALYGTLRAACLATGPYQRVACVGVTQDAAGVHVGPIATTDPLVTGDVAVEPDSSGSPACAACL